MEKHPLPENPTLDQRVQYIDSRKTWNFEERMARADELAAWALRPCKEKEEADDNGSRD